MRSLAVVMASNGVWVKQDKNNSKKYDGNTYWTDLKVISIVDDKPVSDLTIGDAVIVNTGKSSKAKCKDWLGTIAEEPKIQAPASKRKAPNQNKASKAKKPCFLVPVQRVIFEASIFREFRESPANPRKLKSPKY